MRKAVVLLSGGLDSCTALAFAKDVGDEVVLAIGFRYGSRHNQWENLTAAAVASHYGVPFHLVDVSGAMAPGNSALMQGGPALPEGHYEEESMRLTVVPGRNLILIAHAAAAAERVGAGKLYIGTHAGDHFIYPDCRPDFLYHAAEAVWASSDKKVKLESPFTKWAKKDIVCRGHDLGAPYHLTRTCYASTQLACGRCGSCIERREAFELCGLQDPIPYAHTGPLPPKPPKEDIIERRGTGGVI